MNSNQKEKILKAIKLGVNKFELIDAFDLEKDDLKELNDFYDIALKVKKSIESNNNFLTELYASEVDEEDYNLILNFFIKKKVFVKQKKPNINIKKWIKIILKNIGILIVLVFLAIILFSIFSNFFQIDFNFGNLDFSSINFNPLNIFLPNNQKEIIISGLIIGELTDFSKTKISVNGANLSSFDFNKNNFEIKVKCVDDFVIDFSLADFVPIHKQIDFCVNQKIGIFMTKISKFENIDLTKKNIVSNNSVSVDLNGADLVIFGKNISPKDAKISVTGFNPNNVEDLKYFPGKLEGIDENGVKTSFVSFGFAKILATDSKGNKLDFKNENARISFSIDPIQADLTPTKVILWNYNEKKGIWEYVGVAIKNCDTKCVYDANLTKIGSWFSVGSQTAPQVNIAINGFDFSSTNNRVDVAVAPVVTSGPPTVNLNPGEKIENLNEIKTDMVCEYDSSTKKTKIENYNRKSLVSVYVDKEAGFMLWTTTKTDYFGKGVAQVLKDASGNVVREIETECVCREEETVTNRYLISCAGYNENGYYDNCVRKGVSFSCAGAKVENICGDDLNLSNDFYKLVDAFNSMSDSELLNFLKNNFELDYNEQLINYLTKLSPEEFAFGALITQSAQNQLNSGHWKSISSRWPWISASPGQMLSGDGTSGKCNLFVYDMYKAAGINLPLIERENKRSFEYTTGLYRQQSNLPGLRKLTDLEFPLPSDIVTSGHHVMVVSGFGEVIGTAGSNNEKITRLTEGQFGPHKTNYLNLINSDAYARINQKDSDKAEELAVLSYSVKPGYTYWRVDPDQLQNLSKEICLKNYNSKMNILSSVEEFNSFNEWLNSVQPAKINLNNISGNFIMSTNSGDKDISVYDGIDLISGQIFYPINDFVYYSEVPSINEKLFGGLIVYDSFIVDQGGGYSIGNNNGLFKLEDNSIIQKSGEKLIIQNGDSIFEFGEKVGNIYFITKSKSSNIKSEINYSYENGLLKEINLYNSKTIFNYVGNTLENIVYESSGEDVLTEEFDYLENKLSQVLYKVNGEIIFDTNYNKTENYFEIKNSLYSQKFNLTNNQVTKIENSSFDSNGDLVTINVDFEYSKDYTYITSDGYTNTCFKGICFIDELLNSITTSAKCVDYYPNSAEVNDFDKFVLVINGLDKNKNNFMIRENIDKNKINNMVSVKVPINSDLNLFLELNGVPSDPIILKLGNDPINVSNLLDSPKNCSNTMISFGGFSLDNCVGYAQDENKLINCLLGSVGMFDTNTSDLINFISGLDTSNELKETVISFIENMFK